MRTAAARSIFATVLCASSALAEEAVPVSPAEFLALVEGKTVHYEVDGQHYGTERFYGKGRATWQFPADTCEDGLYWPAEEELCFRYGRISCWSVTKDSEDRMTAVSGDGFSVMIDRIDNSPLRCDGNPVS